MQTVPKIVTDRLRTSLAAVNHPDADVLTAFSERSLPEQERAIVLEHLARCGDCRDIVALALPEAEPSQIVVRPASSGWLTWPALRWGFVAVGIFAIASFGILWQRRSAQQSVATFSSRPKGVAKVAQNETPAVPAAGASDKDSERAKAPATSAVAVPSVNAPTQEKAKEFDRLEPIDGLQGPAPGSHSRKATSGMTAGGVIGGPLPHGPEVQYQNTRSFQLNNNVQNNAANVPAANLPEAYKKQPPNAFVGQDTLATRSAPAPAVAARTQTAQANVQGQNRQDLALETKSMPLQPSEGGQGHAAEPTQEAGIGYDLKPRHAVGSAPAPPSTLSLHPPSASWTISAGNLQRSLDQGQTWQNVDVNNAPPGGMNYDVASASPEVVVNKAKVVDSKKDMAKQIALPLVFRAVAANGADVWAGGSGGQLYHSLDSGAHWTRILPVAGSVGLTGDILSLNFPDVLHGKVTTSTAEVWMTSDSGLTWQKQ